MYIFIIFKDFKSSDNFFFKNGKYRLWKKNFLFLRYGGFIGEWLYRMYFWLYYGNWNVEFWLMVCN